MRIFRNKKCNFTFFSIVVLLAGGCGSQDYGPPQPSSFHSILKEVLPAVEKQKGAPPTVVFGSDVNDESICPRDAICMESSYLGSHQLEWLASERHDFVEKEKGGDLSTFRITTDRKLIIDTVVFEIPSNINVIACSGELLVSALAVGGGGVVDSSGEACHRPDGTKLTFISAEPNSLIVNASGRKGARGASPEIPANERRAADGIPESASFITKSKTTPMKICLSVGACGAPGDETNKKMEDNFKWIEERHLFSVADLRLFVWESLVKGKYGEKYWNQHDPLEYAPTLSCELQADKENETTELFESAQILSEKLDGLNGAPSTKAWAGGKGGVGGNAGEVTLISNQEVASSFRISSEAGEAGEAGPVVAQSPGLGVNPAVRSWGMKFKTKYRIFCKGGLEHHSKRTENGVVVEKEDYSTTHPGFDRRLEKEYSFIFALGKTSQYEITKGLFGEALLSESFRGRDGSPFDSSEIEKMKPLKGEPGLARSPAIQVIEKQTDYLSKLKELCPSCRVTADPQSFLKEHEL